MGGYERYLQITPWGFPRKEARKKIKKKKTLEREQFEPRKQSSANRLAGSIAAELRIGETLPSSGDLQ